MNTKNPQNIIAPPPILFLLFFLTALGIDVLIPKKLLQPNPLWVFVSLGLFFSSLIVVRLSFLTLRKAKTSPNPFNTPTKLVTKGPFSFSRNPIYLAMVGFYLSGAMLANSVWFFSALPLLILLMNWGVIKREEQFLEQQFDEDYRTYRLKVRRWI